MGKRRAPVPDPPPSPTQRAEQGHPGVTNHLRLEHRNERFWPAQIRRQGVRRHWKVIPGLKVGDFLPFPTYEGRSISNAPDPLPMAVEQRNLAQLSVFLYIGTTQSYAFLSSFDAALETVFVEHPRLVIQPRRDFKNQG